MVTGPVGRFSGATEEELSTRLSNIAKACVAVWQKGHLPVSGVYQAYPMLDFVESQERQVDTVAGICLGLAARCDAILAIGTSSGVNQEIAEFTARGKPVYRSLDELPPAESVEPAPTAAR